jgi:hypothetical protein
MEMKQPFALKISKNKKYDENNSVIKQTMRRIPCRMYVMIVPCLLCLLQYMDWFPDKLMVKDISIKPLS